MGWDAIASPLELEDVGGGEVRIRIRDKRTRQVFEEASAEVKEEAGSVDGYLHIGGLDCSICGQMLEKMTGLTYFDKEGWSEAKVQLLYFGKNGVIDMKPNVALKSDLWAYLSARKFLECCAKLNLSVRFSW